MNDARREVDLRSDTVTQPCEPMREAMACARVGDDVAGEDPTVNALQREVAARFGKPAALFVPSGTMANQLALLTHCRRGDHVIAPTGAHLFTAESGGGAALAGVQLQERGEAGRYDLSTLSTNLDDPHYPPTTLITVENTHNGSGGRVLPLAYLEALRERARSLGVSVHMDGARIFNALIATGASPEAMAACVDSLSVCLSKGLGAPVGSLLLGDVPFICRAHRFRKMLGGGMRQSGILAAGGRYALEHNVARLAQDHARARALAEGLATMPGVALELATVESNIVIFRLTDIEPTVFVDRLAAQGVRCYPFGPGRVRWVTHLHVDDAAVEYALSRARQVLEALSPSS